MRPALLTTPLLGGLLCALSLGACSLRPDVPSPRFLEPALPPAAAADPTTASDLAARLGVIDSDELLRRDLLRYAGDAEVRRDPLWRWTDPPSQALRQRLELAAGSLGIALRDRADLPLVTATVLRFGVLEGATAQEFTVQILLRCRLPDGTERTRIVAAQAPFSGTLPGTLPQVAGTLLTTVSTDAWAQVRTWSKPGGG